jgi:endonuclease/exonuclease/phosphatase family metal-dependent hydrolase
VPASVSQKQESTGRVRLIELEAEARKPLLDEPVEDLLVLAGGLAVESCGVAVAVLEQRLPSLIDEVEVVAVEFLGLVPRRRVVGVEGLAALVEEASVLRCVELELPLDEVDEASPHPPRLVAPMRLLVRSWNLYHGRTHPQSSGLHLEAMVRLVTADAPDVVALQEVPLWAAKRLDDWSGMSASWAMTMPALLGPLSRRVTASDPERYRSSLTGQANALLVNPHFDVGRHRRVVLNPGLSRQDWLLRGGQRRVCQSLEVERDGEGIVLANLHASKSPDPELAGREIQHAAAFLADASRCVLCGDFNLDRHLVPGFSEPIGGIDQILVRGAEVERGTDVWPVERRTVGGMVLSDHAPVEAVISSTS